VFALGPFHEEGSRIYDSYLCELRAKQPRDEPVMRDAIEAFDAIQTEVVSEADGLNRQRSRDVALKQS
jgi:hypothetical protein